MLDDFNVLIMLLSIITINYNNAEGLRKTLASVASQTYAEIEHIIIDGGSTDESVEIIREYADNQAKGERLEVKGEENGKADTPASTLYTLHSTPNTPVSSYPKCPRPLVEQFCSVRGQRCRLRVLRRRSYAIYRGTA